VDDFDHVKHDEEFEGIGKGYVITSYIKDGEGNLRSFDKEDIFSVPILAQTAKGLVDHMYSDLHPEYKIGAAAMVLKQNGTLDVAISNKLE